MKSKVLNVGIGQCGGILANEMKLKDRRYTNLFINSSEGDLSGLETVDMETNVFLYSGGDGSGSNREKAKKYIINDSARLHSTLQKYSQFQFANVYYSTDGGTGSGSIVGFVSMARQALPNMIINLIGVLPNLKEDNRKLKNSLECINDLARIENIVNNMMFINNNKGKTYKEINDRATTDLNNLYNMIGHDEIGSIDENNLTNVIKSKGYGVILNLPTGYSNYEEAIKTAKNNSIFAIPDNLYCEYGAIYVNKGLYNPSKLIEKFEADETIYRTYGDKFNMITLGGCEIPTQDIQDIQDTLKERELRKSNEKRNRGFETLNIDSDKYKKQSETKKEEPISKDDDYSNFDPNKFMF